ncbi:MAG: DUF4445 domain-containing protein [Chitinispirillaceae bacterium]|nr:DUF4445 domain-containing protein [Chitinispirillaceae bacterium]
MSFTVLFEPSKKKISVPEGTLISDAAIMAGLASLHLPCGGRGTCGKCLVRVSPKNGPSSAARSVLACRTRITHDLAVWIEEQAQLSTSCIVAHADLEKQLLKQCDVTPLCRKIAIQTPRPGIDDNYSDLERLVAELARQIPHKKIRCSLEVLYTMSMRLRERDGLVSATLDAGDETLEIINLESGDTGQTSWGIACDLGTTTVSLRLVDLASGRICATASDANGQISRGADVISRIEYSSTESRRNEIRRLALDTVNTLIHEACATGNVSPESVSCMFVAGNSAMTHLFLGLPARWLREHPYVPSVKRVPPLSAAECGITICGRAPIRFSPLVGSYVGGDITAGLLCTDMLQKRDTITLFIDIGTNGEIVIGSGEFLLTAACSAGPAFEGSGIRCGMRACAGAIDSFCIDDNGASVDWTAIGNGRPSGICGSGLISLLGELLKANCIDRNGKFTDTVPEERRINNHQRTAAMALVPARETANGRDITISEADIDNLIRTKAAIYAACDLMLANAGLSFSDVEQVLIAGGFGRCIAIDDAVRIGLFPDLERSRFRYLGNTSLVGATLSLVSENYRRELNGLVNRITYIELSNDPHYMDAYVAALFLPHTDLKRFGITPS